MKKSASENFLMLINLECSQGCPDCIYAKILGKGHMSITRIKDQIAPHITHFHHIDVSGGEPTEHPDFWKVIEILAARTPKYLRVITNGLSFSDDLSKANKFVSRLEKAASATGTPISFAVAADDMHASNLKGKAKEMKERVKVLLEAFKNKQNVGLYFCCGLRGAQTKQTLSAKYNIPKDKIVSFKWKKGKHKQYGTVKRLVITPNGHVYPTEAALVKGEPMGRIKSRSSLKHIARRL